MKRVFIMALARLCLPFILVFELTITTGCFPNNTSGLKGIVRDITKNGIEGVQVVSGNVTAYTESDGSFHLALQPGEDQIVVFSREGYVTSSMRVTIYKDALTYLPVTMMVEAEPKQLDVATGGTVTGLRGATLTARPSSFVDSEGNPVSGTVEVSLTPYDPAIPEEALAYPGELRGLTLDGEIVPLETFGVLDVTVRQNGKLLQIKPGETVDIIIPAPSKGEMPATAGIWHFDKEACLWVEYERDASYDPINNSFSVSVDHLSPINVDNPSIPTCIYGMVQFEGGTPVVGASITAQSADENDTRGVYSFTHTGFHGEYCMTVEKDSEVLLTVTAHDGTVTERRFKAGSTLSRDYPADCSTSNCLQLRTITIGTPDTGQDSDEANCEFDESNNPFMGTCAHNLGNFYSCFSPSGTCTYDLEWGWAGFSFHYETTFENGSKMVYDFEMLSAKGVTKFYGPDPFNHYCGSMETDYNGTKIIPKNGGEFSIRVTENGGIEIECDGVVSFIANGEQMDALNGCAGKISEEEGMGVGCTPVPGSFMAPCSFNSQCKHNYSCCGPPFGEKKCLPDEFCDVYENSCSSNSDCALYGENFVCCSTGWFDTCLPIELCK